MSTNSNDCFYFKAPAGAQAETTSYPTMQWWNGNGKQPGRIEAPDKFFSHIFGDTLPVFDIEHQGAETGSDPAYLFETIHFAAVTKHVSYYVGAGKERQWFTEYKPGLFSRVKMLGFCREVEAVAPLTPVIVTFRSSVARDFNAVAKAFRTDVLITADKIAAELAREAGREAPAKFLPYAFYLPFGSAGKRVKTGSGSQKSQYTPLEGKWNGDVFKSDDRATVIEALKALATPPDLRNYICDSFYDTAREWLEAEKAKLAGHVDTQEFTAPEGEE